MPRTVVPVLLCLAMSLCYCAAADAAAASSNPGYLLTAVINILSSLSA